MGQGSQVGSQLHSRPQESVSAGERVSWTPSLAAGEPLLVGEGLPTSHHTCVRPSGESPGGGACWLRLSQLGEKCLSLEPPPLHLADVSSEWVGVLSVCVGPHVAPASSAPS